MILGTVSPDHPSPSTACAVQHALGLPQVPAFDVSAACAGLSSASNAFWLTMIAFFGSQACVSYQYLMCS